MSLQHQVELENPSEGAAATSASTTQQLKAASLIKPANDKLEYRFVTLENGLRAVLVHDAEADKAAASMDVNVGSLSDPNELPGLAHFTEHMLFYSSAKYPKEDEYSKFISDHGGHTNAYTATEDTNYHFDVNWDNLEPALDRFAQFFISPLISADGVDREVKAVDSEHSNHISTDMWRQLQLYKCTANPAHPWARFSTGNIETLGNLPKAKGIDVRQGVVDFHARHYSAHLMRLAVVSRHSLDELEQMVREKFAAVPNTGAPLDEPPTDVFLPEHKQMMVKTVPVKEGHTLELSWQVPASTPHYRTSPLNYLSHLLGHEGEGSAFALMKSLGWAHSLVAGESHLSLSSVSFFYVRVELSELGHQHAAEVAGIIFRYLDLVRQPGGISQAVWEEARSLQQLRFDFRDKPSPYNYASSLSSSMHHYPDSDLLLAMYHVPQEYNPKLIEDALAMMRADTVRMFWSAREHADVCDQEEPWYGTKYWYGPIPQAWREAWTALEPEPRLHMPAPNPFIPTDFALATDEPSASAAQPTIISEVAGRLRLWHKTDVTFQTPKAIMYFDFQCPDAYTTPANAIMTRIIVKLLIDALNEVAYPAELAGLAYNVYNSQSGWSLTISGYNHKLRVLLDTVLDYLVKLEVKPDRFAVVREQVVREFANMKFQQPYQQAMYSRDLLLTYRRWPADLYVELGKKLEAADVAAFLPKLMSRCFTEAFIVGNVRASDALAAGSDVLRILSEHMSTGPVPAPEMRDLRVIQLPAGVTSVLVEKGPNPENDNSAVVVYYQVGLDSVRQNALAQLLVQLSKRDAFHVLRTQQQLGYIVHLYGGSEHGVHDMQFLVQSNAFSCAELTVRINAFVQALLNDMLPAKCQSASQLSDQPSSPNDEALASEPAELAPALSEFEKAIAELAKAKLERPKRLAELANRWWAEIHGGTWLFDRQELEVVELRKITPEELLQFATDLLGPSSQRRKLVVQLRGSGELTQPAEIAAAAAQPVSSDSTTASPAPAPASAADSLADKAAEVVEVIEDMHVFKQTCAVWPSVAALAASGKLHNGMGRIKL